MRIAVAMLLAIHGLIHLLGFLKSWKLADIPQLSGRAMIPLTETGTRVVGSLWLLACLILLAAAALRLMRHESFWIAAGAGIVVSQALILLQWPDAKAGTVANLLLVLPVAVGFATSRFNRRVDDEVRALFERVPDGRAAVVQPADLTGLPAPVRRWLEVSGVVGRERARVVRLRQRGAMRTSPDGAWMPAEAEQYFSIDEPGFVWRVNVEMMRVLPITGRDKYAGGKGHMLIKLASLLSIADASGDKIDQGTLLRYLGEMVWFPSAALSPYITWDPEGASTARATMSYGGVTASAIFSFDDRGRFSSMSADRYFEQGGASTLERWVVPASAWRVVRGVEIPVRGDVVWKLKAGDFNYYRWEILDVEQNRAALYSEAPADALGAPDGRPDQQAVGDAAVAGSH